MCLSGCVGESTTAGSEVGQGADSRSASVATAGPVDVTGATVTFEGGHAETLCFGFDTAPSVEYILSPEATGCSADVAWKGGDALTQILVRAKAGDFSQSAIADALRKAGIEPLRTSRIAVDGVEATRIDFENAFGLQTTAVFVPLPAGRYFQGDVELTAVSVSANTYNADLEDLLLALVNTFDIHA
jgi:hypothetical protein